MLKEWKELDKPGEEELKLRLDAAKEKLARQQLLIKEQKIPVLVVMEGWGTSGKGYSIGQIIQNIDPRFLRLSQCRKRQKKMRENHFCIGILQRFRRLESLYF